MATREPRPPLQSPLSAAPSTPPSKNRSRAVKAGVSHTEPSAFDDVPKFASSFSDPRLELSLPLSHPHSSPPDSVPDDDPSLPQELLRRVLESTPPISPYSKSPSRVGSASGRDPPGRQPPTPKSFEDRFEAGSFVPESFASYINTKRFAKSVQIERSGVSGGVSVTTAFSSSPSGSRFATIRSPASAASSSSPASYFSTTVDTESLPSYAPSAIRRPSPRRFAPVHAPKSSADSKVPVPHLEVPATFHLTAPPIRQKGRFDGLLVAEDPESPSRNPKYSVIRDAETLPPQQLSALAPSSPNHNATFSTVAAAVAVSLGSPRKHHLPPQSATPRRPAEVHPPSEPQLPTSFYETTSNPIPPIEAFVSRANSDVPVTSNAVVKMVKPGHWEHVSFPGLTPMNRREVSSLDAALTSLLDLSRSLQQGQSHVSPRPAASPLDAYVDTQFSRDELRALDKPLNRCPPDPLVAAHAATNSIIQSLEREASVYDLVYRELVRQEGVHCRERADLLERIRGEYRGLLENVGHDAMEAKRAVEESAKDAYLIRSQVAALTLSLESLQASFHEEVAAFKRVIEDKHKVELARAEHRAAIEIARSKTEHRSATVIQRIARGRKGRRRAKMQLIAKMATRIANMFRKLKSRAQLRWMRKKRNEAIVAVVLLQRVWRGTAVRIRARRRISNENRRNTAARNVTSAFRFKAARLKFLKHQAMREAEKNRPIFQLILELKKVTTRIEQLENGLYIADEAAEKTIRPGLLEDKKLEVDEVQSRLASLERVMFIRNSIKLSKERAEAFKALAAEKGPFGSVVVEPLLGDPATRALREEKRLTSINDEGSPKKGNRFGGVDEGRRRTGQIAGSLDNGAEEKIKAEKAATAAAATAKNKKQPNLLAGLAEDRMEKIRQQHAQKIADELAEADDEEDTEEYASTPIPTTHTNLSPLLSKRNRSISPKPAFELDDEAVSTLKIDPWSENDGQPLAVYVDTLSPPRFEEIGFASALNSSTLVRSAGIQQATDRLNSAVASVTDRVLPQTTAATPEAEASKKLGAHAPSGKGNSRTSNVGRETKVAPTTKQQHHTEPVSHRRRSTSIQHHDVAAPHHRPGSSSHHHEGITKDHSLQNHSLFDEMLDEEAFLTSLLERRSEKVASRARQRVEFIRSSVAATFVKDRPSLQKLLGQLELADKLEEALKKQVVGVFREPGEQAAARDGQVSAVAVVGASESHDAPSSASQPVSAIKKVSAIDVEKSGEHSPTASRKSMAVSDICVAKMDPNRINISDEGAVLIGTCSEMQPLLRLVDEVYGVEVRPAKALSALAKLINELYGSVADDLIKAGKFKYDGYKSIKTLGFNLSENPNMVTGSELREYEKSIFGLAPEDKLTETELSVAASIGKYSNVSAGLNLGAVVSQRKNLHEYWRPLHTSGPDLVYHAILKIRGQAKACDQQIVDLVKSSTTYRSVDEDVNVFCQLMEIDSHRSSAFTMALYVRHELQKGQIASMDNEHIPCTTYASVIALATKLFQVDDATVQRVAKKVIQVWEVDKSVELASVYALKIEDQLEYFFCKVWKAARPPEADGCLSYAGQDRGKTAKASESAAKSDVGVGGSGALDAAPSAGAVAAVGATIAAKKTKQIISSRRQSIVEIGTFSRSSSLGGFEGDMDDLDLDALPEGDESADEDDGAKRKATVLDTVAAAAAEIKVKEEMYRWLCPIGSVLDICLAAHNRHSKRQLHGVWSTVVFVQCDTQQKGVLTVEQFTVALKDTLPKRSNDEVRELYSDLIYGSSNQLMTYSTFKTSTFQLMSQGFLDFNEPEAGDILDVALALEIKRYVPS